MLYWLCFFIAVLTEIIGTLTMKHFSVMGGSFGLIVMYIMIIFSYLFLAIAIKRIALGVAYALWEGIGGFFITVFSVMLFGESMTIIKFTGLLMLLGGIILVKSGTKKPLKLDC